MLKIASLALCLFAPLALTGCGAAPTESDPAAANPAVTSPAAAVTNPTAATESQNSVPPLCAQEGGHCFTLQDCHRFEGDPAAGQLDCHAGAICCVL